MDMDKVPPAGLEPATPCLEGRCSIQLSYEGMGQLSLFEATMPFDSRFSGLFFNLSRLQVICRW